MYDFEEKIIELQIKHWFGGERGDSNLQGQRKKENFVSIISSGIVVRNDAPEHRMSLSTNG